MVKVGIVLVNYNGAKYQNDCIRTLYGMEYSDFIVIVVDSCSKDNSLDLLEQEFPEVHILRQTENVGVARGNNIGIRYCMKLGAEYTLLLNNDTEVDEKMLSHLLCSANATTVTVPKIYFFQNNNVLWFAGGWLDWNKATAFHRGINEIDREQYDKEEYINYSPTCCMLIHNDIFKKVGLVDEKIFMYFDDTDLCVRFLEAHISIKYIPKAKVWHKVSSSSGGMVSKIGIYYSNRNQLYYMKKYKNRISARAKIRIILRGLAKGVLSPFRNLNDRYILIAYSDYLIGKMGRKNF